MKEKEIDFEIENDFEIKKMRNPDFLTCNGKVTHNLIECLNVANDYVIESCYSIFIDKLHKSNLNTEEKRDFLKQNLQDFLKKNYEEIIPCDIEYMIEQSIVKGKIDKIYYTMALSGLMYCFKENDQYTYVIPKEIQDIYLEHNKTEEERKMHKIDYLNLYLESYFRICGSVLKTELKSVLERNLNISITDEEFAKLYVYELGDTHYTSPTIADLAEAFKEEFTDQLKKIPYVNLSYYELSMYHINYLDKLRDRLVSINKQIDPYYVIDMLIGVGNFDEYDVLDEIKEKYNLASNEMKKVENFLDDNINKIRRVKYKGMSDNDLYLLDLCNERRLRKVPQKRTLKNCVNALSDSKKFMFLKLHDVESIEELEEVIYADIDIDDYNETNIDLFLYSENKPVTAASLIFIEDDFAFVDKDNNLIITNEAKVYFDIFKMHLTNSKIEDCAYKYMITNFVLKREKLQELLDMSGYGVSIDDLDYIIEEELEMAIQKDYYVCSNALEDSFLDAMVECKDSFSKYKILYDDDLKSIDDLLDILVECCQNIYSNDPLDMALYILCYYQFMYPIEDSFFEELSEEYDVSLTLKDKKAIYDFESKYVNDIPIYVYNGFSQNEIKKLKPKKVGRNEPCTCGSGKKYKHCCGK